MGFNTVVLLLNDRLEEYQNQSEELVKQICLRAGCGDDDATLEARGQHPYLPGQAQIISVHHADNTALVAAGGNYGTKLGEFWGYSHHTPENQIELLRVFAAKLGYRIVKK